MNVTGLYLIVAAIGIVLALIAYFRNRNNIGGIIIGFTLMEIVIMAVIGVINGVLGTRTPMLGRLFMTFSGSYGFLAFAAICGFFYISGPLAAYIIRKPGAATIAETMNGVAQVLSGNPNGVMVLGAGFLQGFMSDMAFAFYGYKTGRSRSWLCPERWLRCCSRFRRSTSSASVTWASATILSRLRSEWSVAPSMPSSSSVRSPAALPAPAVVRGTAVAAEEGKARLHGQVA